MYVKGSIEINNKLDEQERYRQMKQITVLK